MEPEIPETRRAFMFSEVIISEAEGNIGPRCSPKEKPTYDALLQEHHDLMQQDKTYNALFNRFASAHARVEKIGDKIDFDYGKSISDFIRNPVKWLTNVFYRIQYEFDSFAEMKACDGMHDIRDAHAASALTPMPK